MQISIEKLKPLILRKEYRYLWLCLFWVIVTISLTTQVEALNYYKLRPLIQSKLCLVAIIFLGREILFQSYRHRKILITSVLFIFLTLFGLHLSALFKIFNWLGLGLLALDAAFWSLFSGLGIEIAVSCFLFWYRLESLTWIEYTLYWTRCWSEIVSWGLWMVLLESLTYFYLINFYMMDTIFYSYLYAAFLIISGLALFATFFSKTTSWVLAEVEAIDEKIQEYLGWRTIPPEEVEQFGQYFQWLLVLRGYFNGLKRPRFSLKSLFYYLIFTMFLLGLPYIFGAVVEV
jgi:hypothetical protein